MESDAKFLLRRASEESLKAMTSNEPQASDAHEKMAIRYSAKAAMALADTEEPSAAPTDPASLAA